MDRDRAGEPRSDLHAEAELLPLSGLQHLVFCERQCALIHLEQTWVENRLTAEGQLLHQRVDDSSADSRVDTRIVRGLPLRSLRLGLAGRADVVEFHRVPGGAGGAELPGLEGYWRPFPVDYKRGGPKWIDCDRTQLCAQALCLEEMLRVRVSTGALFYGRIRRREEIEFSSSLRRATELAARRFHELIANRETPVVTRAPKCRSCSLISVCAPPTRRRSTVTSYLDRMLAEKPE